MKTLLCFSDRNGIAEIMDDDEQDEQDTQAPSTEEKKIEEGIDVSVSPVQKTPEVSSS
jgi:hypothetical protein